MLSRWLALRVMARVAVAGLALGMAALATLTVWGTANTQRATAEVRSFNEIAAKWHEALVHLSTEDSALRSFLAAGGAEHRRGPLLAAIGSVGQDLAWLEREGGAVEATHVGYVRDNYAEYTVLVRKVLAASDRGDDISGYQELATISFAPLRSEIAVNVQRKQQEATTFLAGIDRTNLMLRWVAAGVAAVDVLLILACAAVLVGYRRRAEKSASVTRHQAAHDSLTGLANRKRLTEEMAQAVADVDDIGGSVGLLLIDLDGFKEINDTLGHHQGDMMLQQVADRLNGLRRATDVVARLGGDEFAVLLPGVRTVGQVEGVAERVQAAIRRPIDLNGIRIDLSASIGAAVYPDDSDGVDTLLAHADVAMYVAKRGRLGISVYDPEHDEHDTDRLSLLGELREGIGAGQVVLHYQPKVDAVTRQPRGVEALVRWQHPDKGLLYPDRFIPLVEKGELIDDLTDEVVRIAAEQASAWRARGWQVPIAVNVAARTLLQPQFPTRVIEILQRFELPPHLITLELTESALITDPYAAAQVLRQLREAGLRLSIDDFGTGFSSMAHLRDMPVHELKVDRSFVATMTTDFRNKTIVNAVIDLARNLRLETVAEGVEDEETLVLLRDLGCRSIQGYHIARPLPADNATAWLERQLAAPIAA